MIKTVIVRPKLILSAKFDTMAAREKYLNFWLNFGGVVDHMLDLLCVLGI